MIRESATDAGFPLARCDAMPLRARYNRRMADEFDPYRKWLGISSKRQPPTHYDLLGIELDEDDRDVINSAAERRIGYVRSQLGKGHDQAAHGVIYQIQEAQLTLLDPALRREYDQKLKLFGKRKRRRQVNPNAGVRGYDAGGLPPRTVGVGGSVGEGSDFLRSYAGIVAILCVAFGAMLWWSFAQPWEKLADNGAAPADNAFFDAIADDDEPEEIAPPPRAGGQPDETVAVSAAQSTQEPDVTASGTQPAGPPLGAVSFGNRMYKAYRGPISWSAAEERCRELGGRLPVVGSRGLNDFLVGLAKEQLRPIDNRDEGVWISGTDAFHEGKWVTSGRAKLPWSNWGPGQPNNKRSAEHYAMLRLRTGEWSDQPNDSSQHLTHFVCEWDAPPTTSSPDPPPPADAKPASTDPLVGTEWINVRGITFRFTSDDTVGHGRLPDLTDRPWKRLDSSSGRITYVGSHSGTLKFADDLRTFRQLPYGSADGAMLALRIRDGQQVGTFLTADDAEPMVAPKNSRKLGDPNRLWRVDGLIHESVANGSKSVWSRTSYADFDLVFDWRIAPGGRASANGAGVLIGVDGWNDLGYDPRGYEYDLLTGPPTSERYGTIIAYDRPVNADNGRWNGKRDVRAVRKPPEARIGDWQSVRIRKEGGRMFVWVEGKMVNDAVISPAAGRIAFRSQNVPLQLRNIAVLPAE